MSKRDTLRVFLRFSDVLASSFFLLLLGAQRAALSLGRTITKHVGSISEHDKARFEQIVNGEVVSDKFASHRALALGTFSSAQTLYLRYQASA